MSAFFTASVLSDVKMTSLYSLNLLKELVFLLVKYKALTTSLINKPFAIDCPKLPAPIIATFIIYYFCALLYSKGIQNQLALSVIFFF